MSEVLQVGKVIYEIMGDNPFFLNQYDRRFLGKINEYEKWISVYTKEIDKIELPEVGSGYETPLFIAAADPEHGEKRYHKTTASGKCQIYARSTLCDNRLEIAFNSETGIWRKPGLQVWTMIHLESLLLETNGIPLHCSYMMYHDQAILFTAPSGTGKTTQADIWKRVYHSEIINGDRCLLQKNKEAWEAWGYPGHGCAAECFNRNFPIRAIVIVRQAPVDEVIELTPIQKLALIYSECTVNSWDQERVQKALDLIGDLISKVTVLQLNCTMNDTAAQTLHRYLYDRLQTEKRD